MSRTHILMGFGVGAVYCAKVGAFTGVGGSRVLGGGEAMSRRGYFQALPLNGGHYGKVDRTWVSLGMANHEVESGAGTIPEGSNPALSRHDFTVGAAAGAGALLGLPLTAFAEEGVSVSTAVEGRGEGDAGGMPSPAAQAPSQAKESSTKVETRIQEFQVPYTGKSLPLNKFLGKATLVVNPKIDDPESLKQMPSITKIAQRYANEGLTVLLFPTDQGYFEPDEDRVVRVKFYQFYGFGQYPRAVVFDKVDIVGNTIHPFYRYLCSSMKNPNGIARITLNYEKFLLDSNGVPVRRYPRKLEAEDFEEDIKAVLAGEPVPPENRDFKLSWVKANTEAQKSEYAFKLGLNYYNNT
ncbi:unnamed protein product [Discosporangium mesarthrocarpum]